MSKPKPLHERPYDTCKHCYCRYPKHWMGTGPAPVKCCKCGHEKVDPHGKTY